MNFVLFFWEYATWHYTTALAEFWGFWRTFLWFLFNFFSIPLMVRTLFAPFRRLEIHQRRVSIEEHLSNFVANTLMRILGFILRVFMIAIGLAALLITLCISVISFVLWVLVPATLISLFISGAYFSIIG